MGFLLQVIDPHTHQYMDRMKDEPVFLALASKASDYLGGRGEVKAQAKIALRRVEHFYYKTDTVYGAMRRMTIAQQEAQQQAAPVPQVVLYQCCLELQSNLFCELFVRTCACGLLYRALRMLQTQEKFKV